MPPIVRRKNQWGCVMANSQAKLMYPGLAGFYENFVCASKRSRSDMTEAGYKTRYG
jgi:hypothetical protein